MRLVSRQENLLPIHGVEGEGEAAGYDANPSISIVEDSLQTVLCNTNDVQTAIA